MVIQQALHRIWCGAKRVGLYRAFGPHLNAKYKQFLVVVGSVDVVGFGPKKCFLGETWLTSKTRSAMTYVTFWPTSMV